MADQDDDDKEKPKNTESVNFRSKDFRAFYVNNLQFDVTVFDLTAFIGRLERQPNGALFINQEASITLSWSEAKLAAIFFVLNVAAQEEREGPIAVPASMLPNIISESASLPLDEMLDLLIQAKTSLQPPKD